MGDNGAAVDPDDDETKAGTTGLAKIPMTRELVRGVAWNRMKGSCEHPGKGLWAVARGLGTRFKSPNTNRCKCRRCIVELKKESEW